jgi:type IV pilus assembly protein PilC
MNRPLNLKEICFFTRTFSTLLASSPSVAGTIDAVINKKTCGRVANALSAVAADIRSGDSISQAFQKHEPLFGAFFCSMVIQGEKTGNLAPAFMKLSEYYESRHAYHKKITRLLKYPLFILFGTSGCLITLLFFMVPMGLRNALAGPEELAPAAEATASLFIFIQTHMLDAALWSAFVIGLIFLLWRGILKAALISALTWKIPVAGDVIRKNSLQRFALSLSTLLSSGFDSGHALTIAAAELRNRTQEKRILHALIDTISSPGTVYSILKKLSIFPPFIIEMANNGKKTYQIDEYLKKIAAFYQDEVEAAFNAFAILAGPVFVMVSGLLGIGIVVSLYLPVFKLVGNH